MTVATSAQRRTEADLEVTEEVRDMVMTAYRLACTNHIQTVAQLRMKLSQLYPDKEPQITKALNVWARRERELVA